jgi:hypothetical protein
MAVYANCEFAANTTKSEEEEGRIVLHVIFCIFGRNSQDVVQFLKFFIGLLEVPYRIFCIFGSPL